jgi:hypothetical protein
MNTNDNGVYDNAIYACYIHEGDRVKELGQILSVLVIDKSVFLYVADQNNCRVFDYPYDTLFELDA